MTLILPIHERGRSSHPLVSSGSFYNVLELSLDKSFTCLVSVVSNISFFPFCKGTVSYASFSASLLFVCRKATDFYMFCFYIYIQLL